MATVSLREEVTELLQALIRIDTTNPPGNETVAAELLRDYLVESGVEVELYARVPERANMVARIPGRGNGPSLLLLSHTDVVLADPAEWSADPFGGELRDGEVWGRGALDMKGQVAASAIALASLARDGFEPEGDLIFAATADEEVGAGFGAQWLCEAHPEAVRCDYVINEGAGDRVVLGSRPFYICAVSEKMSAPFLLRVKGRSGHASMPGIADNALVKAAPLITALGDYVP
jgi:acetylornithine deacetylase/succinyl-diaminopimelate desuccinylase-like protein